MTRMQDPPAGHMEVLHECMQNRLRVRVVIRSFKGIRGICIGFIEAFDKFFNLVLRDVDEIYKLPSKGQRFYHEESVTVSKILEFSSEIPVQKKAKHKYQTNSRQNGHRLNVIKETLAVGEQSSTNSDQEQYESCYNDSESRSVDQESSSGDIDENREVEAKWSCHEVGSDNSDGLENMEAELHALKEQLAQEEDEDYESNERGEDFVGLENRLALLQEQLSQDDEEDTEKRNKEENNAQHFETRKGEIESEESTNEKYVKTHKVDIESEELINEKHVKTLTEVKINEKHVENPTEKTVVKDKDTIGKQSSEYFNLELQKSKSSELEINKSLNQLDINLNNQIKNAIPNISPKQHVSSVVDAPSLRAADKCGKVKLKPEDFRRRHANQLFIRGDNVVLVAVETALLPQY
ncbi:uncharacterized protein LOC117122330 isoform X2 [Anneissia japonica]|nr:uncharacterized protein LOC117122330 isoform X2 [Anneissia japonica]